MGVRHVLRVAATGFAAAMLVALGGVADGAPSATRAGDCVADGSVTTSAVFNQPHDDDGDDDRIHRHIVCLVEGAPAGSEIRVATYHFAHRNIRDALLDAHDAPTDPDYYHTNNSGGTNPGNRTIVRVGIWAINGATGSDPGSQIAHRLWELDNEGCYVDIVADNDGNFEGKPDRKVVFTGSYNFTKRSVVRNDETWLRINDPNVHDRFRDRFFEIRAAAHTCWQTSKPEGCDGGRAVDTDPPAPLNCHETADKYQDAGNLYLYSTNYCEGANDAKDDSGTG